MEGPPVPAGAHLPAVGQQHPALGQPRQTGAAECFVLHGGGAHLRPQHIGGAVAHFLQFRIGGVQRRQMPPRRGNAAKPAGQVARIGEQTARPGIAVDGEHRVGEIQPVGAAQQRQVKGPVLRPAHILPEPHAAGGQPVPPDAVFPHRPVGGIVQPRHSGGVVAALKGPRYKVQMGGGQRFAGILKIFQIPPHQPVFLRMGGGLCPQRFQQAGGHFVVAVQKQHPLSSGRVQPGVARCRKPAVLPVQRLHAGHLGGQRVTDAAAAVGGAIVNQQALPVRRTGLVRHRGHAGRQIILHIVHRHNDGKQGFALPAHPVTPRKESVSCPADTGRSVWCGRTSGPAPAPVCPARHKGTAPTSCRWSCSK